MRSTRIHALRPALAFLLTLLCLGAFQAAAQTLASGESVANRARPGYDANGIAVGKMTLLPRVGGEVRYSNNVLADNELRIDDTAFLVSPQILLESRSERHLVEVGANADLARFADRETESYHDARLWAVTRRDLGPGEIEGELRVARLHQERASPDDLGCTHYNDEILCTRLTEFRTDRAAVAYSYLPGRLMLRGDLSYTTTDYDDTLLPLRTRAMSNDDRDRSSADVGLRLGYAFSPAYAAYVETRIDSTEYEQRKDRDGFQRSSEGIEARLGMLLDFSGNTVGEAYLGYFERDFADQRFGTAGGPTFGADIRWDINNATTLSIAGRRHIESTIVFGASAISKSRLSLSADHELSGNLVLNAAIGIGKDEFENLEREDELIEFRLGGTYYLTRYLRMALGYRHRTRNTSPANTGARVFDAGELFLRMVGQL
jgi:hypothetical protein